MFGKPYDKRNIQFEFHHSIYTPEDFSTFINVFSSIYVCCYKNFTQVFDACGTAETCSSRCVVIPF